MFEEIKPFKTQFPATLNIWRLFL